MFRDFQWMFLVLVLALGGCGAKVDQSPPLQPVTGTILLDGKPIPGASVAFVPRGDTPGLVSVGTTNETGAFECVYPTGQPGVPTGEYKVLISKLVTPSGDPIPEGKTAADVEAKDIIPAKYKRLDDLINTIAVGPGGKKDLKFELTSR